MMYKRPLTIYTKDPYSNEYSEESFEFFANRDSSNYLKNRYRNSSLVIDVTDPRSDYKVNYDNCNKIVIKEGKSEKKSDRSDRGKKNDKYTDCDDKYIIYCERQMCESLRNALINRGGINKYAISIGFVDGYCYNLYLNEFFDQFEQ